MAISIDRHLKYLLIRSTEEITREDGLDLDELIQSRELFENVMVCVLDFTQLKNIHATSLKSIAVIQDIVRKNHGNVAVCLNDHQLKNILLEKGIVRGKEICGTGESLLHVLKQPKMVVNK